MIATVFSYSVRVSLHIETYSWRTLVLLLLVLLTIICVYLCSGPRVRSQAISSQGDFLLSEVRETRQIR